MKKFNLLICLHFCNISFASNFSTYQTTASEQDCNYPPLFYDDYVPGPTSPFPDETLPCNDPFKIPSRGVKRKIDPFDGALNDEQNVQIDPDVPYVPTNPPYLYEYPSCFPVYPTIPNNNFASNLSCEEFLEAILTPSTPYVPGPTSPFPDETLPCIDPLDEALNDEQDVQIYPDVPYVPTNPPYVYEYPSCFQVYPTLPNNNFASNLTGDEKFAPETSAIKSADKEKSINKIRNLAPVFFAFVKCICDEGNGASISGDGKISISDLALLINATYGASKRRTNNLKSRVKKSSIQKFIKETISNNVEVTICERFRPRFDELVAYFIARKRGDEQSAPAETSTIKRIGNEKKIVIKKWQFEKFSEKKPINRIKNLAPVFFALVKSICDEGNGASIRGDGKIFISDLAVLINATYGASEGGTTNDLKNRKQQIRTYFKTSPRNNVEVTICEKFRSKFDQLVDYFKKSSSQIGCDKVQ